MDQKSYRSIGYQRVETQVVKAPPNGAEDPSTPALMQMAADHHRAGRLRPAEQIYRAILARNPEHAVALDYLGILAHQQGHDEEAIQLIEAAIRAEPGRAAYLSDLATVQQHRGDLDTAIANFRRAITIEPGFADAHYNLGNALVEHEEREAAIASYRRAIAIAPSHVRAQFNLANTLNAAGRTGEALSLFQRVVALDARIAGAHTAIASICWTRGRLREAADAFRRSLALDPSQPKVHSDLIYLITYNGLAAESEILEECRRFERQHAPNPAEAGRPHANIPDAGRRLRIGYVSPDLRSHCVAHFIEPLLATHDRGQVEIFCYAEVATPDATTDRLRRLADHWRSTVGVSDIDIARQVRQDGIDILVDLAGHTAQSRLLAFAHKPAPVQVTWIGFLGTTGLSAIDYIIAHPLMIPEAKRRFYSETVFDLEGYVTFAHPRHDLAPAPTPVLTRGHVTFGCFNNAAKIRPPAIAAWARILDRVPKSRLILKSAPLSDPDTVAELSGRFAAAGTDLARIEFRGASLFQDYLRSFADIDIALDPFPANGGTTTRDTLLMGVPLVTLWGETFAGRVGGATMAAIGLPELAARDIDGYVDIAVRLAGDRDRLVSLRGEIRGRTERSLISDTTTVTRRVEAAFREMWTRWCSGAPRG
jgi:protein O-GlcNAc transferase